MPFGRQPSAGFGGGLTPRQPLGSSSTKGDLPSWDSWLEHSLRILGDSKLQRYLHPASVEALSPGEVELSHDSWSAWLEEMAPQSKTSPMQSPLEGRRTLMLFSSNDYLGLSMHPEVCAAAAANARQHGIGVRSSPLVAGFSHIHAALEAALARLKGTEDCLLFSSGFSANVSVMGALASDPEVDVFSDEFNHASIIDGLRVAARGRTHVYRHNDMHHLDSLLNENRTKGRRQLVITDSLFSMDGDFANMKDLAGLRRRHGFCLAIDEAHATLVCGHSGGGAAEAAGVGNEVDIHIGTLSKAVGGHGGFVACSRQAKAWLLNKGRSFVYSTALPGPLAAAALQALQVAQRESWRRQHLWELVRRFAAAVGVTAHSPIIPIVLGSEQAALQASSALLREGFHVPAIRPPTVPEGTCRLRVALSAAHSFSDVDRLATAIKAIGLPDQTVSGPPASAGETERPKALAARL